MPWLVYYEARLNLGRCDAISYEDARKARLAQAEGAMVAEQRAPSPKSSLTTQTVVRATREGTTPAPALLLPHAPRHPR